MLSLDKVSNMADKAALEELLRASVESGDLSSDIVQELFLSIQNQQITLLSLIESLRGPLLDGKPLNRFRAVSLVAQMVELLVCGHTLQGKDLEVLAQFFCSKLKDHHSVLPAALYGLQSLSSSRDLPSGLATTIVQSMFQEIHCQSQLQSDRRKVYNVLKNFLSYRLKELQILGQDFIFNFIQAVDQERDPRNLLVIFSCVPIIAKFIKVEPFTEEFFEVFSCYFPIDFTAPHDDQYGLSRSQLADGLSKCMASSSQFAEYCLPLLQTKMESDFLSAKIDAWKTLELCCGIYSASHLENWIQVFWDLARRELMVNVNTDNLEHAVLDALTAISKVFTSSVTTSESTAFQEVFQEILNECKGHLCEPERRLMTPSLNILLALCAGNRGACSVINRECIPLLLDQYRSHNAVIPRQLLLRALNKIINAGLYGFTAQNANESGVFEWSDSLFALYENILHQEEDAPLKSLSLSGFTELFPFKILKHEHGIVVKLVMELLVQTQIDHLLEEQMHIFFQSIANHEENLMCQQIIPLLLKYIDNGDASCERALLVISRLLLPTTIQSEVIYKLLDKLEISSSFKVQVNILNTLSGMCERQGKLLSAVDIFWRLHAWALEKISIESLYFFELISSLSALLRNISSLIDFRDAAELAKQLAKLYLKDSFLLNSPALIFVMESSVGSLNVCLEGSILVELTTVLESVALSHSNFKIRESACRLISALLNKSAEGPDFDSTVTYLIRNIDCGYEPEQSNSVHLYIWIVKGLVMKGYSKTGSMIQKLITLLNDKSTKLIAAEGFSTILSDTVECLNSKSHANIRILYRQRFFQQTVPNLLSAYRQSSEPNPACLTAVANQLSYMSNGILVSHGAELIIMFIQCLAPEQDAQLILSTIKAIIGLFPEGIPCIINHIDTLIPRLLVLGKEGKTLDVRRMALKCLGLLCSAPAVSIVPLRTRVIIQLLPCLDDKKRLVRREAAATRHKWIMLGQPGSMQDQFAK